MGYSEYNGKDKLKYLRYYIQHPPAYDRSWSVPIQENTPTIRHVTFTTPKASEINFSDKFTFRSYHYPQSAAGGKSTFIWAVLTKGNKPVGLTIVNALNLIPDPTTKGLSDSKQALRYIKPRNDKEYL
ncbi:hypothetical protein IPU53_06295 [Bacillus sp. SD088]|nr:hypothetical protein [Bacillus sp. SD088]